MARRVHALSPAVTLVGAVAVTLLLAAEPGAADPPRGLSSTPWRLEAIEFLDGRRLEGLIVPVEGDDILFVQVVRRPGRPMYIIRWGPLPADRIRSFDRLPPAEREQLAARIDAYREGRQRRQNAETEVRLVRDEEQGAWRYTNADFLLESTADARITREAVVRLEQMLGALANLVPPVADPDAARFTVRLCGSLAEYREVQAELGIRVENAAFFVPARRLLVAGSDMPVIVDRERAAAEANALAEKQLDAFDRDLAARLMTLASDLEKQGVPAAQRADVVQRARTRWKNESDAERARIETANRENAGRVAAARRDFYARLAHEAWHAYAECRLRSRSQGRLPLWLDEGLAQVVESAPLEAGELRLDLPDPVRLAALQEQLQAARGPTLGDVLRSSPEQFIAGHVAARADTARAYLAAWGLALDLAMLRPVITPTALAAFCGPADREQDPVARFEALVGMPIGEFEPGWRKRVLDLRVKPGQ